MSKGMRLVIAVVAILVLTTVTATLPRIDWRCINASGSVAVAVEGVPELNVKDFGAKGDGVTNDAPAIQTAVDTCPSGGTIIVPKGTFLCNAVITISKPIRLLGEGDAILIHTAAIPILSINPSIAGNVAIDELTFDGQSKSSTLISYFLSYVDTGSRTTNVYIKNCTFKNAGIPGFATGHNLGNNGINIRFLNECIVEHCTFDTIEYFGVACNLSNSVILKYNSFVNCGLYGITCNDSLYCVTDHNYFKNCGSGGFDAEVADYKNSKTKIVWTNNYLQDCGNDDWGWGGGIVPGNGCSGIISGNTIKNFNMVNKKTYLYAIPTARCEDLVITGNMIIGCGARGININSSDVELYRASITNNYVDKAEGVGIYVYFSNHVAVIGNKVMNGKLEGIYINQSNSGLIVGNQVHDNSLASAGLYAGIRIRGCAGIKCSANSVSEVETT